MKLDLQSAAVSVQHIRTELAEKEHECRSMSRALKDEEKKSTQLEKRVEGIQNEKDQLSAEMMKKNEEINLFEEKRELMKYALDRGSRFIHRICSTEIYLLFTVCRRKTIH